MILLVDIDHTVADAAWRDYLMGNWAEYHKSSFFDKPIPEVVRLVQDLQKAGWRAFGFTMRPARWRRLTTTWLESVAKLHFEELLMREEDEWRPSAEAKCALLAARFPNHDHFKEPMILLDDHGEVCSALAKLNITTLQVSARRGVKVRQ